jgi:hypothetical protein
MFRDKEIAEEIENRTEYRSTTEKKDRCRSPTEKRGVSTAGKNELNRWGVSTAAKGRVE